MNRLHSQILRIAAELPKGDPTRRQILESVRLSYSQHVAHRVAVKELPQTVQRALREVGYGRRDIEVTPATSFSYQAFGGDGQRSFVCIINMETGQFKVDHGSWGGPNPFAQKQVDVDNRDHQIPANGAVIQGSAGSGPVYATLKVHPSNMPTLLPAQIEVTPQEEMALAILKGIKSSYRPDYFREHQLGPYAASNPLVQGLVSKGLVKATGTGLQITTEGKNAVKPSTRP